MGINSRHRGRVSKGCGACFLSNDLHKVERQLAEKYIYQATVTIGGVVYKHDLSKHEFIKYTEVVFNGGGSFKNYQVDINEITINSRKAYVESAMSNSFNIDGITQKCAGKSNVEIEEINGVIFMNKTNIAAKCQNLKDKEILHNKSFH